MPSGGVTAFGSIIVRLNLTFRPDVASVLGPGNEPISNPRISKDVARLCRIGFDLLAEMADEDSKIFSLICGIPAPNICEQRTMC